MTKSSKGSQFEREICKYLSLWWTHGESDAVFWRTSQSGGRSTTRKKSKIATPYSAGDIGLLDPVGKPFLDYFLLELKRGYSKKNQLEVLDILDSRKKQHMLFGWWEKAEAERGEDNRKAVLIIFKRDFHTGIVVVDDTVISELEGENGILIAEEIRVIQEDRILSMFKIEDFFEWLEPRSIKNVMEEGGG